MVGYLLNYIKGHEEIQQKQGKPLKDINYAKMVRKFARDFFDEQQREKKRKEDRIHAAKMNKRMHQRMYNKNKNKR